MSEFDDLVKKHGVLAAGRFGPDWTIAEQKSTSLFIELPKAVEFMAWFCALAQMMFNSMAFAAGGFMPSSLLPVRGWVFSGGPYSIGMRGRRFVIVQSEMVESFDDIIGMMHEGDT
jgi:roadblock/LC7 domain-containing protein